MRLCFRLMHAGGTRIAPNPRRRTPYAGEGLEANRPLYHKPYTLTPKHWAASDCIPIDKAGDFYRAMGCSPSLSEIAEAVAMVDPDGEGVARSRKTSLRV